MRADREPSEAIRDVLRAGVFGRDPKTEAVTISEFVI